MGCPETLITDQGGEFVNKLSSELYSITNTEHRITSAYHPQSNGLTERFNQTLSRSLAKITDEDHTDWDLKIDTILMGYRASRQGSTKFSPYYMLFQKNMRLPICNEIGPKNEEKILTDDSSLNTLINSLLQSQEKAFQQAEQNIKIAQKKQKQTYDRKHQLQEFEINTLVMLENTIQKQRKGGKLEPLWLGPYSIHRCLGKGVYELTNKDGKVLKKKTNIARLKVYNTRVSVYM